MTLFTSPTPFTLQIDYCHNCLRVRRSGVVDWLSKKKIGSLVFRLGIDVGWRVEGGGLVFPAPGGYKYKAQKTISAAFGGQQSKILPSKAKYLVLLWQKLSIQILL